MWIPESISLLAAGMSQFALIWFLALTSKPALNISLAMAIIMIPKALLNPFIGAIVDRFNRKSLMIFARITVAIYSSTLVVLFIGGFLLPIHIFIALFIRSTVDTCHNKAMMSSISMMVPSNELTKIAGLTQAISGIIMVIAPAISTVLLKVCSLKIILALDSLGAMLALTSLLFISIPRMDRRLPKKEQGTLPSLLGDCKEGLRYLIAWKGALAMLAISAVITFIMQPYFGLIAILVKERMNLGEIEYGILGAAIGFGFFVGGCILSIWQGFRRKMVTVLFGIFGAGIFTLLTGKMIFVGFAPCALCFFGAGIMMPLCMGPIQALVQTSARKDMQGRILSIMECISTLAAPLSLIIAGKIFSVAGPQYWYSIGGIIAIIVAIFGLMNKTLRNLGDV